MPRLLFVDAAAGLSPAAFLAALVDAGVPPSPVIHAVAGVPDAPELRFEAASEGGTRGLLVPPQPNAPVENTAVALAATDLTPAELEFAAAALARLAESGTPTTPADVMLLAGVAFALTRVPRDALVAGRVNVGPDPTPGVIALLGDVADRLDFEDVSGVPDPLTDAGAALIATLASQDAFGAPEPAWSQAPAMGKGRDEDGRIVEVKHGITE